MSEQRPVPQQFPSRRQRREQQEPPAAPLSPAPGQPRAPQPPVAQPPGAQPYGAPPRVPQQSALPPQVVSQGVTSAVPPAGFQSHAEPSGAARPATSPVESSGTPRRTGAPRGESPGPRCGEPPGPWLATLLHVGPSESSSPRHGKPGSPRFCPGSFPPPGSLDTTRKPRAHPW